MKSPLIVAVCLCSFAASALADSMEPPVKTPATFDVFKSLVGDWVSQGDDNWKDLVYWTMNLLIAAEEDGITQANVDEMKAKSTNPEVQRILGVTENFGGALGLSKEWGYNVIKQVGNYGEMWEKWLGPKTPIGAPRGVNSLWTQGGLMIAPPFR